jgi:hypothetical protein
MLEKNDREEVIVVLSQYRQQVEAERSRKE